MYLGMDRTMPSVNIPYFKLLALCLGKDTSNWQELYMAFQLQQTTSMILFVLTLNFYCTINCFLYIDLLLILVNPFYPMDRRAKYYYFLSAFLCLGSLVYSVYIMTMYRNTDVELSVELLRLQSAYFILVLFPIMFFALLFIIYRLCRRGSSPNIRRTIIRRYVLYFAIFMPQFLFYFCLCMCKDFYLQKTAHYLNMVVYISGIFIAFARLKEPYVWQFVRFRLRGKPSKLSKSQRTTDPSIARPTVSFGADQNKEVPEMATQIAISFERLTPEKQTEQNRLFDLTPSFKSARSPQFEGNLPGVETLDPLEALEEAAYPEPKPPVKVKFAKESLCQFLNSAINIEFVYMILVGINKLVETNQRRYEEVDALAMDDFSRKSSVISARRKVERVKLEKGKQHTKITL